MSDRGTRHEIRIYTTLIHEVKKLFTFAHRLEMTPPDCIGICDKYNYSIFYFSMKELNLIALLGFYILSPFATADMQSHGEVFAQKIIVGASQNPIWGEKSSSVYYLNKKETLHKTADVAVKTVEPTAATIFSESKPVIQNGKRFVRPKIPFLA